MYQRLNSSKKLIETFFLIKYILDDKEKRKEMENMILNWETDSRPATADTEE